MASEQTGVLDRARDFLERLLALKVPESERYRYAGDPLYYLGNEESDQKPMRVATILAVLIHLILFFMFFPSFGKTQLEPQEPILVLKQLSRPAEQAGGGPPEVKVEPPKPKEVVSKPKPVLVPIPDPTPDEPEPIEKEEIQEAPKVTKEITADLNLTDLGPPTDSGSSGRGRRGAGTGRSEGDGTAAGSGDGPYEIGSLGSPPVPIVQTTPSYTDDAIKAKVQGVVWLQGTITKEGRVTDLKVLRGLGYGLEERAIQEIAANWRFRPGTVNGKPVDVRATIEVQFNLR